MSNVFKKIYKFKTKKDIKVFYDNLSEYIKADISLKSYVLGGRLNDSKTTKGRIYVSEDIKERNGYTLIYLKRYSARVFIDILEETNIKCGCCGNEVSEVHENILDNNEFVCADCVNNNKVIYCNTCSVFHKTESLKQYTYIDKYGTKATSYLCEYNISKLKTCSDCGSLYLDMGDCVNTNINSCHKCILSKTDKCEICGATGNIRLNKYGYLVCPSHYNLDRSDFLLSYGTKKKLKALSKYKDKGENGICIGVEIEVNDLRRNGPSKINELFVDLTKDILSQKKTICEDSIIYKSDGSLNYGVEFVSDPFSVGMYMKQMKNKILSIIDICKKYNGSTDDGTGLHVHIDREGLGLQGIVNVYHFINNNNEFCIQIAGRESSFAEYDHKLNPYEDTVDVIQNKEINRNRRVAVNMCNSKTIEVRIFQSSLDIVELLGRIEFIFSLIEFQKGKNILDMTTKKYLDYIKGLKQNIINYPQYENLFKLLETFN